MAIWIWLAIGSYFIWAFVNLIDKIILDKYLKNPLVVNLIDTFFGTLLIVLYIVFFKHINFLPWLILLAVITAGGIRFISYWLYYKAIGKEEASRVTMLFQLSPIFTLVFAYFLVDERLTYLQLIAFCLLFLGGVIASLHHHEKKFKLSPAFWIMLMASLSIALSTVLLKFGFKINDFWPVMFWAMIGEFITTISLALAWRKNFLGIFTKLVRPAQIMIVLGVIASSLAFILNSKALELGSASIITVLSVTNPIFVFLLAILATLFIPKIIKEELSVKTIIIKVIALLFIGSGLFFLVK